MASKPSWQERLADLESRNASKNIDEVFDRYVTAHNKDVGLPGVNGASVFVREDNSIDIYSKEGLGIRIDPDTNSISFYCSKFNVHSKQIDLYHDMFGLKTNKFPMNLQYTLFGGCAAGPVTVYPGTILTYYTGPQDVAAYMMKVAGTLGAR